MLWILVSNRSGRDVFLHQNGPLEFGRGPRRDVARKVIQDPTVSTNHLCLEELQENRIRLCNLSTKVTVRLADGSLIDPGCERSASLPTRIQLGDTLIEIESTDGKESAPGETSLRTVQPPVAAGSAGRTRISQLGDAPDIEELTRWFEALVGVERAAASSPDFFAETARAVVELIGLDIGWVLTAPGGSLGARGLLSSA